jgi:hypothetical protein
MDIFPWWLTIEIFFDHQCFVPPVREINIGQSSQCQHVFLPQLFLFWR